MAEPTVDDEYAEIKKRATRRLIIAGTLVAVAVVALTVLNHKTEDRKTPVTTAEAPTAAKPEPLPPLAEPESSAEDQAIEVPLPEAPQIPDSEAAPSLPPPPPPQVVNRTSPPQPVTLPKAAGSEVAAPARSAVPQSVTISPAPVPKKPAETLAAESKPAAVPPAAPVRATEPAAQRGYVVQLGLFTNHENAVQLQKRLAEHGIKSHTETRLHVGPFQNKAEADEALNKIRGMGINAVLAPAR